jgi:hypothetical protein
MMHPKGKAWGACESSNRCATDIVPTARGSAPVFGVTTKPEEVD